MKCTVSTFRIYHHYRSMFTSRRPSDIHKFNGQKLLVDKYMIILVCAVHVISRSSLIFSCTCINEMFSNEESLHIVPTLRILEILFY